MVQIHKLKDEYKLNKFLDKSGLLSFEYMDISVPFMKVGRIALAHHFFR